MSKLPRVRVSVCNVRTPTDVVAVVQGGADAIGVHVSPDHQSPTTIHLDQALALLDHVPPYMGRYATTTAVHQTDLDLLVSSLPIDTLHLSPAVTADTARALRHYHPHLRLVKSLTVSPPELSDPTIWPGLVDAILFDTHDTQDLPRAWADIASLAATLAIPVVLAGGLTPANAHLAATTVRPWALNVDTGVTAGGHKDPELIAALVSAAQL